MPACGGWPDRRGEHVGKARATNKRAPGSANRGPLWAGGPRSPGSSLGPGSGPVVSADLGPVDDLPDLFQVLDPRVAVVNVVGVLPDIDGEQGLLAGGHGGAGVGGVHQLDGAVGILHQPGPAGAEIGGGGLGELLLELLEGAELGIDGRGQGTGGGTAAIGAQAVPVEGVVPDLGGVVEDPAGGLHDDVLEGHGLELGPGDQVVEIGDVGLVVLAVVVLDGLLGDHGGKGVLRIRQGGQFMGHVRGSPEVRLAGRNMGVGGRDLKPGGKFLTAIFAKKPSRERRRLAGWGRRRPPAGRYPKAPAAPGHEA